MEIQKIIKYGDRKMGLLKQYPKYGLYIDMHTGIRECLSDFELGQLKEMVAPPKQDRNPEKVII